MSANLEGKGERPAYFGRVRYTPERARIYQQRAPSRHKSEMRLIQRAFELVPRGSVLDAPCGGGRVGLWLAHRGYAVTAADLSEGMLDITRQKVAAESLNVTVEKQDVESLNYDSKSFDAVVSFRLFHHFPNTTIRARVVNELCRVARRHVLLSYFHPWSTAAIKRRMEMFCFGGMPNKHPTSLCEVSGYFQQSGFRLVRDFAQSPFFRTLHLAVFERIDRSSGE